MKLHAIIFNERGQGAIWPGLRLWLVITLSLGLFVALLLGMIFSHHH
ncbi:hypothetical protein BX283_5805 [Streptomyces sp. TLI_146]|nr:hypothetical protein BX283_5805 [Streptomyces sp. TLI_146]